MRALFIYLAVLACAGLAISAEIAIADILLPQPSAELAEALPS